MFDTSKVSRLHSVWRWNFQEAENHLVSIWFHAQFPAPGDNSVKTSWGENNLASVWWLILVPCSVYRPWWKPDENNLVSILWLSLVPCSVPQIRSSKSESHQVFRAMKGVTVSKPCLISWEKIVCNTRQCDGTNCRSQLAAGGGACSFDGFTAVRSGEGSKQSSIAQCTAPVHNALYHITHYEVHTKSSGWFWLHCTLYTECSLYRVHCALYRYIAQWTVSHTINDKRRLSAAICYMTQQFCRSSGDVTAVLLYIVSFGVSMCQYLDFCDVTETI